MLTGWPNRGGVISNALMSSSLVYADCDLKCTFLKLAYSLGLKPTAYSVSERLH